MGEEKSKILPRWSKKIEKIESSTRAHVSGWNWRNNIYTDGEQARKIRKKEEKDKYLQTPEVSSTPPTMAKSVSCLHFATLIEELVGLLLRSSGLQLRCIESIIIIREHKLVE